MKAIKKHANIQFHICIIFKGLAGRFLPAISHSLNQSNMFFFSSERVQQISLAQLNEQCSEFYLFCQSITSVECFNDFPNDF